MKKLSLLIVLSLISVCSAFAQIQWFQGSGPTTAVFDLYECNDTTLTVYIRNTTAAPMTNVELEVQLPNGVEYISNSWQNSGSISLNQGAITNFSNPKFTATSLPANGTIILTYRVRVKCGTPNGSVVIPIVFNWFGGVSAPAGLNSINILKPSLALTSITNQNFTTFLGNSLSQTLRVANNGQGYFRLNRTGNFAKVNLDPGTCYAYSNPSIGTIVGDTLLLPLTSLPAAMQGGNNNVLWETGEFIDITFDVTTTCCNNLSRDLSAVWGCDNSICNVSNVLTTTNIFSNVTPSLDVALPVKDFDYCYNGTDNVVQQLRIVNTGAGPATNIDVRLRRFIPGSLTSRIHFITAGGWVLRDANNAPINTITNFTNSSTGTYRDPNCTNYTANYITSANLGNYILAPGDTVYLDVKTGAENLNCITNCFNAFGWLGMQAELDYDNQCATASYNTPYATMLVRAYSYAAFTLNAPVDVNDGDNFNICLNHGQLRTITHPNGNGTHYIVIPLTNTDLSPTASSLNYTASNNITYTLGVNVVTDTMYVGPLPINTNSLQGNICIPMTATCGTGGVQTIEAWHKVKYDSTCANAPHLRLVCASTTINVKCNTPCPTGGATPSSFTLERISFGLPDNDDNHIPDLAGVIDLNLVDTKASVNGDTLLGLWNIKILPNTDASDPNFGSAPAFTYIDFDMGASGYPATGPAGNTYSPNFVTPLPNAVVTVYPLVGPSFTCTVTPTITGQIAKYDLNTCNTWAAGDSLVVEAKFLANGKLFTRGSALYQTNTEVYSSYTANPTGPLGSPNKYTCGVDNDYMNIYHIWQSPYIPAGQQMEGCTNNIRSYMRQYCRQQEPPVMFPYEYRNFYKIDEMKVLIPAEFEYIPNTAHIGVYNIPNADVTRVNDTLIFSNLRFIYNTNGGTYTPGDETESRRLDFQVNPTCDAPTGNIIGSTSSRMLGNTVNTLPNTWGYRSETISNYWYVFNNRYEFTAPISTLANAGIISTSNTSTTWDVKLNNLSNTIPSNLNWIYFGNVGAGVNSFTVLNNGVPIPPFNGGYYPLGTNAGSGTKNLTITANYNICTQGNFTIYTGWDCTNYPSTFNAATCKNDSLTLNISPLASGVNVTSNLPVSPVTAFTPFEVEFTFTDVTDADIDSLISTITLPPGFSYVANNLQVKYPSNAAYVTSPNQGAVTTMGNTLTANVNQMLTSLNGGIQDVSQTNLNQVSFKISLITDCDAKTDFDLFSNNYFKTECTCPLI